MSDRTLIPLLFIICGMALLFLPYFNRDYALRMTALVDRYTELGQLLSATLIVFGEVGLIFFGISLLIARK